MNFFKWCTGRKQNRGYFVYFPVLEQGMSPFYKKKMNQTVPTYSEAAQCSVLACILGPTLPS